MRISQSLFANGLAETISRSRAEDVQAEITVSVLRQAQEQQRRQAASLLKMIDTSSRSSGKQIDIRI
jgi:hypothetical protein